MFCLFYDAKAKKVHSLNGSGRCPANAGLDKIRADLNIAPGKTGSLPMSSVLAVTTPGAAAGWVDTVEKFGSGKLSLEQILTPAIKLGEEGFPVSELSAFFVSSSFSFFDNWLTVYSGGREKISFVMHPRTTRRCSRRTQPPKTAPEVHHQGIL